MAQSDHLGVPRYVRHRSRDPFAQILAALLVALLPFVGIIIYLIYGRQRRWLKRMNGH
ncbi:MAG: PLDc N-terminal domain-containing protein [Chloroflexi bacterium]|nr:PLDc N-terminal domain-containing protein [Chloroflexota bacterium]